MAFSRELREGEQVVWEGMKLARIEFAHAGIYFSVIPWTAFAFFWIVMAAIGRRVGG